MDILSAAPQKTAATAPALALALTGAAPQQTGGQQAGTQQTLDLFQQILGGMLGVAGGEAATDGTTVQRPRPSPGTMPAVAGIPQDGTAEALAPAPMTAAAADATAAETSLPAVTVFATLAAGALAAGAPGEDATAAEGTEGGAVDPALLAETGTVTVPLQIPAPGLSVVAARGLEGQNSAPQEQVVQAGAPLPQTVAGASDSAVAAPSGPAAPQKAAKSRQADAPQATLGDAVPSPTSGMAAGTEAPPSRVATGEEAGVSVADGNGQNGSPSEDDALAAARDRTANATPTADAQLVTAATAAAAGSTMTQAETTADAGIDAAAAPDALGDGADRADDAAATGAPPRPGSDAAPATVGKPPRAAAPSPSAGGAGKGTEATAAAAGADGDRAVPDSARGSEEAPDRSVRRPPARPDAPDAEPVAAAPAAPQAPRPTQPVGTAATASGSLVERAVAASGGKGDSGLDSSLGRSSGSESDIATDTAARTLSGDATRTDGADFASHLATTRGSRAAPQTLPALQQVAVTIQRGAQEGRNQLTVQLRPDELGRIDVRLEFDSGGRIRARVTADNPYTLDLLQRDSRGLEKALQDAGLRADSGSLSFSLRDEGRQAQQQQSDRGSGKAVAFAVEGGAASDTPQTTPPVRVLAPGRVDVRI
ncbi:flagellar hook-length control protein FliK [Rhodocista pekingensis]|uniref:Flagellar hook-length control protein FliK n=1 Tax=Rhodocista pekingensis TaxID=201185 RepID=A0ABW2KSG1_9PROT